MYLMIIVLRIRLERQIEVKQLRPYQEAADKSLFKYIFENKGNPLVVAPVAAGKSLMIAEFIRKVHEQWPRTRIVMLTHVKELLVQNSEELLAQYPDVDMGFYCSGLNENKLHNDVTFASIQSVYNKLGDFNRLPQIIIIDECHLISHNSETQYRRFINNVLELNPNCRVIGYTGTPFRSDTGRLDDGHNKLFDDIAYEIGMDYMIEQGFWAKPVCPHIATQMDVSGVKVAAGDYVAGQLERAVNKEEITEPCVKEMIEHGKNRRKWLAFTVGVKHADDVTEALVAAGVDARCVHSKMSDEHNKQALKDHRDGKFKALVNVAKLTTGYNDPEIDMLVFMRPTRSPVLYIQTVGRGVRPVYAAGYDLTTQEGRLEAIANSIKPDCMVLDFGGVVAELGAIDTVSIKKKYTGEKKEGEKGEALLKICPSCGVECAASQRYCYSCSYCFIDLNAEAAQKAIVSMDNEPEWLNILQSYSIKHLKKDSYPSMKITYVTMQTAVSEWICFEHHNFDPEDNKRYAWNKAVAWHKLRLPDTPCPTSVDEALEITYPTPSRIQVRLEGKFYRILDYEFGRPDDQVDLLEEDYIPF